MHSLVFLGVKILPKYKKFGWIHTWNQKNCWIFPTFLSKNMKCHPKYIEAMP
jgi:hypothetical protein